MTFFIRNTSIFRCRKIKKRMSSPWYSYWYNHFFNWKQKTNRWHAILATVIIYFFWKMMCFNQNQFFMNTIRNSIGIICIVYKHSMWVFSMALLHRTSKTICDYIFNGNSMKIQTKPLKRKSIAWNQHRYGIILQIGGNMRLHVCTCVYMRVTTTVSI